MKRLRPMNSRDNWNMCVRIRRSLLILIFPGLYNCRILSIIPIIFHLTWSISVSQLNSNVNINGDISISPKWKLGGGFYFDFKTQQIQATSIYLTRDMHCWQMVIDVNIGQYKSFTITLNPKSGILRDLRINKHFLQQ